MRSGFRNCDSSLFDLVALLAAHTRFFHQPNQRGTGLVISRMLNCCCQRTDVSWRSRSRESEALACLRLACCWLRTGVWFESESRGPNSRQCENGDQLARGCELSLCDVDTLPAQTCVRRLGSRPQTPNCQVRVVLC